jgi:hypothetical protein
MGNNSKAQTLEQMLSLGLFLSSRKPHAFLSSATKKIFTLSGRRPSHYDLWTPQDFARGHASETTA